MKPFAAFRDPTDYIHLAIGFVAGFLALSGGFQSALAGIIIMIYAVYQAKEEEPEVVTVADFIEFLVGFVLGEALYALISVPPLTS